MNIVLITNLSRPQLTKQSLDSLQENAVNRDSHHLTLVVDGATGREITDFVKSVPDGISVDVMIKTASRVGASRARNIGAGSVPKYRRQEHVMFCDDDIYACPGWDEKLMAIQATSMEIGRITSGYSHPYNICEPREGYGEPLVISSVAMMMDWELFDKYGPWDEPGGAGASEDYALCMRVAKHKFVFAVTEPQCIIHCGLRSSTGEKIVGHEELVVQNMELVDLYGLQGKVIFG